MSNSKKVTSPVPAPPIHAPVNQFQLEVDRLLQDNKAGITEIFSQLDIPSQLSLRCDLINLRMEVLAELVFGEGPGMLQFKLRFERKVAEAINDLRNQLRQAQLAAAAQASPQQVQQMAAAQGFLLGPDGNPIRR